MLQHLRIENYALIRLLDIDLTAGFCVVTGETGAGKSILLGALGLVLGQRADSGILLDSDKKCIIEAHFRTDGLDLARFFEENDLDTDPADTLLILRREVLPGGKSRAFVNDTPVTLPVLKELSSTLVDIHSQHETLTLGRSDFQRQLLDSYLEDRNLPAQYARVYEAYDKLGKTLEKEKEVREKWQQEQDYCQFLHEELDRLNLQAGEQKQMEEALERLSHSEQLKTTLTAAVAELDGEEFSIRSRLDHVVRSLKKIASYHSGVASQSGRWDSVLAELADLERDLVRWADEGDTDPECKNRYEERLDMLYRLERKHHVDDELGLIGIRDQLAKKIRDITGTEERIQALEAEYTALESDLRKWAEALHHQRSLSAGALEKAIVKALEALGMGQSRLEIRISPVGRFTASGADRIDFFFSANPGSPLQEISKVASGGELSRLMLAVKSVIHHRDLLGTLIFDEIDTGVSGKIAGKVAAMMQEMSRYMQIIAITHLPQIAAAAQTHLRVYKSVEDGRSFSNISQLSREEHLQAIASMLSNENVTDAALKAAEELIKG